MIRKIKFRNFYSFKDEQVIDFTVSKKKSNDYFETYDGKQISKIAGFVGANGSGKTNVMKLFGFLGYFLTAPNRTEGFNDTGFKSYAFSKVGDSSFFVEFETEKSFFTYKIVINPKKVISEELNVKPLKKKAKLLNVFLRNGKNIKINKRFIKGVTAKKLKSILDQVSVVAFIKANYDENIINEVFNYFDDYHAINVNETGSVYSVDHLLDQTALYYHKNPKLKNKADEFIKNFDIGIDSFKIDPSDSNNIVHACHKISKKDYHLPIAYESHGTKALFVELPRILSYLASGHCLIIDEIEAGFHPQAVNKIIQYIIDKVENKKKQFIFTSHSLDFLKKFDAQQIFLVKKDNNSSEVYRLDELNVRPDENFFSKYVSGAYGAFPKIRI